MSTRGRWVHLREAERFAIATFAAKRDPRAVELTAWASTSATAGATGSGVTVCESGIHRGPAWRTPAGMVRPGDRLIGFHLDESAWAAVESGALTPRGALRAASGASTTRKVHAMSRKKLVKKLAKAEATLARQSYPSVSSDDYAALAGHRGVSLAGQQAGPPPYTAAAALAQLEKAVKRLPKRSLERRDAQRELAVVKMQFAEHARAARPMPSRLGPGSTELFPRGVGRLGEDRDVGGI